MVFKEFVEYLYSIGFYTYLLPALLFTVFSYGLLKKSKILGESAALNGFISILLGLMVFGSPFFLSIDFSRTLSLFFVQMFSFLLVFFIGILISAFFYPDLLKILEETMKRRTTLWAMIALGIIMFLTSGLFTIFTLPSQTVALKPPPFPKTEEERTMYSTLILLVLLGVIVFMLLVISYMRRRE